MDLSEHWEGMLLGATAVSLVALVFSMFALPIVVARLPADYFSQPRRSRWAENHGSPGARLALGFAKNALGAVLVVLGIMMLVTPGQGLLTLLIGLLLMNFPGKYQLERWLVLRPGVLRALNWIRKRRGCPPFEAPRTDS